MRWGATRTPTHTLPPATDKARAHPPPEVPSTPTPRAPGLKSGSRRGHLINRGRQLAHNVETGKVRAHAALESMRIIARHDGGIGDRMLAWIEDETGDGSGSHLRQCRQSNQE